MNSDHRNQSSVIEVYSKSRETSFTEHVIDVYSTPRKSLIRKFILEDLDFQSQEQNTPLSLIPKPVIEVYSTSKEYSFDEHLNFDTQQQNTPLSLIPKPLIEVYSTSKECSFSRKNFHEDLNFHTQQENTPLSLISNSSYILKVYFNICILIYITNEIIIFVL